MSQRRVHNFIVSLDRYATGNGQTTDAAARRGRPSDIVYRSLLADATSMAHGQAADTGATYCCHQGSGSDGHGRPGDNQAIASRSCAGYE
jgi:hypothetical protein